MIFNMVAGGAALNFKIIGGTVQPENPMENTIWVDTDVEITGWHFGTTAPGEPVDGMVWIRTDTFSNVGFNALKENGIMVYPLSANQYISDAFVDVEAKSYQGGEWVEWIPASAWYWRGNECENNGGGWISTAWKLQADAGVDAQTFEITREADYLKFTKTGQIGAVIHKEEPVDLTNVKAIHFKGEMSAASKQNWVAFHVWTEIGGNNAYWATNSVATVQTSTSEAVTEFSLDVSALTGSYYIGFGIYDAGNEVKIEELYPEVEA